MKRYAVPLAALAALALALYLGAVLYVLGVEREYRTYARQRRRKTMRLYDGANDPAFTEAQEAAS